MGLVTRAWERYSLNAPTTGEGATETDEEAAEYDRVKARRDDEEAARAPEEERLAPEPRERGMSKTPPAVDHEENEPIAIERAGGGRSHSGWQPPSQRER